MIGRNCLLKSTILATTGASSLIRTHKEKAIKKEREYIYEGGIMIYRVIIEKGEDFGRHYCCGKHRLW
jgi:hypothetical protein